MRFRIITNGILFRIEKRTWFWWTLLYRLFSDETPLWGDAAYSNRKPWDFETQAQCDEFLNKHYGDQITVDALAWRPL